MRARLLILGAIPLILLAAAGLGLLLARFVSPSPHGELVDSVASVDGRYEVQVRNWQSVLGEDGWDIVLHPRDGEDVSAGCLFSEASAHYTGIEAVAAGTVRVLTEEGPVPVAFDPVTLQVTTRIPGDLCGGYV